MGSGWTRLAEAFLVRELSREHSAPLETLQAAHKLFKARATFSDPAPRYFSSAMRDGWLERPAFYAVLRELASAGADAWDLDRAADRAFKDADREHRAGICFREFSAWLGQHAFDELLAAECAEERLENREICLTLGLSLVEVETYRRDFDKFDKSGSGTLDKDEFRQMMGELTRTRASDLPSTRIRLWWQTADRDQTGKITFEEFVMFHRKFFVGGMLGRTELAGDYYCSGMPCTRIARAAVL